MVGAGTSNYPTAREGVQPETIDGTVMTAPAPYIIRPRHKPQVYYVTVDGELIHETMYRDEALDIAHRSGGLVFGTPPAERKFA